MRKAENCLQFFNEEKRGGVGVGKLVGWEVHKFHSSPVHKFTCYKLYESLPYNLVVLYLCFAS
jgi:hypothetical protein